MKPPSIPDAKRLAYECRASGVIVLAFDENGQVAGASYGMTRGQCRVMGAVLDQIVDMLGAGEIALDAERGR